MFLEICEYLRLRIRSKHKSQRQEEGMKTQIDDNGPWRWDIDRRIEAGKLRQGRRRGRCEPMARHDKQYILKKEGEEKAQVVHQQQH